VCYAPQKSKNITYLGGDGGGEGGGGGGGGCGGQYSDADPMTRAGRVQSFAADSDTATTTHAQ